DRRRGVEGRGRKWGGHLVVEAVDAAGVLIRRREVREVGVLRANELSLRVVHERPEALEAGAAERRVDREEEVASPEALASDRSVGLAVDRQEHPAGGWGLWDPLGHDE